MKRYEVQVPLVGSYWCAVEAENEEEAKDKALEAITYADIKSSDLEEFEIDTLEPIEHIMTGNVCHAPLVNIDVEECEE